MNDITSINSERSKENTDKFEERRQWPRLLNENDSVTIKQQNNSYRGIIVNESPGGIAIRLHIQAEFQIEEKVYILLSGSRYPAIVKNHFFDGHCYLLNMKWVHQT